MWNFGNFLGPFGIFNFFAECILFGTQRSLSLPSAIKIHSAKPLGWILNWIFGVFQMTSDEETHNIKVVDLEKLRNFVVQIFFIWIHLRSRICVWISQIWNWNFANDLGSKNLQHQSCRSRKVMKLCSSNFFIWIHLGPRTNNLISG